MASNQTDKVGECLDDQKKETSGVTPSSALLLERLDAAFWNLQDKEKFAQVFCDCDGPELLVSILRKFEEDGLYGAWETAFIIFVSLSSLTHTSLGKALQMDIDGVPEKLFAHNLTKHREKMSQEDMVALVGICASIIYGMSATRDNPDLLNAEDSAEKMQAYLTSDPFLNTLCKITLVYVAEEGEKYSSPEQRTDTTEFLIRILRDALQSPGKKHKGLSDHEIMLALGRLAVQDHNRYKIVEAGALPLLEKLRESQNSHTQEVATNILRNLALPDVVGQKLVEHEDCVRGLESASLSTGSDASEAAKEAL